MTIISETETTGEMGALPKCEKDSHQERICQEGIVMHLDSGDIADNFKNLATADSQEE